MIITLPWPPSVNHYWRNFRGRTVISAKGRLYREAVANEVAKQGAEEYFEGPLVVTIEAFRPDNRKRDLDNLLKATLDGLAYSKLFDDDSQIKDLRIYWSEHIGGMLKVKIERMGCQSVPNAEVGTAK